MAHKINALKRTEAGSEGLELLEISFETKELALQYIKDNLVLGELTYDTDVVVLVVGEEKYHYFEIISV